MPAVIKDDVDQVSCTRLPGNGHRSHVHDGCPVSIQTNDFFVFVSQSYTEGNLGTMPHAAHSEKISIMFLLKSFAQFVELTRYHSRR